MEDTSTLEGVIRSYANKPCSCIAIGYIKVWRCTKFEGRVLSMAVIKTCVATKINLFLLHFDHLKYAALLEYPISIKVEVY